jgi:hypothetical protein
MTRRSRPQRMHHPRTELLPIPHHHDIDALLKEISS